MKYLIKQIKPFDLIIALLILGKTIFFYSSIGVNKSSVIAGLLTIIIIIVVYNGLLVSEKDNWKLFLCVYSFISLLMFLDCLYFSYFNQLLSINQIFQVNKLIVINDSIKFVAPPISTLLLIDIPFVCMHYKKKKAFIIFEEIQKYRHQIKIVSISVFVILILFVINPFDIDTVKAINHNEIITYHIHDVYRNIFGESDNIITSKEDAIKVITDNQEALKENPMYNGIGEGKNLIVIQLESFNNFVLNAEYEGQVLTPNLNELLNKDTIYFENYYQNIGKGNTSDCEFSTLNSMYPVIEGSSYQLFYDNTFYGLPWIMRENGYTSLAFHGYEESFWERDKAYPNQGFEDFISLEDFKLDEQIGFGLADESLYIQTAEYLEQLEQPFFSFIVSLSCHHPYEMPLEHQNIQLLEEDQGKIFGQYMQGVNYADQALGLFIETLKEKGIYDDCVIAIYGDHHGLNAKNAEINLCMERFLGHPYDYDEMLNIPLIIHIPGSGIKDTIDIIGGQVDFLPTIANIMNVEINNPYIFGRDLSNAEEGFVASVTYLLRGSFIYDDIIFEYSREGIYDRSRAWNINTLENVLIDSYVDECRIAKNLLDASKFILENDLIVRK